MSNFQFDMDEIARMAEPSEYNERVRDELYRRFSYCEDMMEGARAHFRHDRYSHMADHMEKIEAQLRLCIIDARLLKIK